MTSASPVPTGTLRPDGIPLVDMHCHLDFARNADEVIAAMAPRDMGAFSNTVTPRGYEAFVANIRDRADVEATVNACGKAARGTHDYAPIPVRIGCGLHPWWVADGTCGAEDVELFEALVAQTPFVGEVGLDFAPRRDGTQERQLAAFERVASACDQGGKVVSIHAVRAATQVLDVLERHRSCERNVCIIHWFSGTSDELTRAVRLGCRFSVGTRMLATKRGRAYARAIPPDRLLLETDLPDDPTDAFDVDAWEADLAQALRLLEEAAGSALGQAVAASSIELLRL